MKTPYLDDVLSTSPEGKITLCETLLSMDRTNFDAMHDLAIAYGNGERIEEAIKNYDEILTNCNDSYILAAVMDSMAQFGDHYVKMRDFKTATLFYQLILQYSSNNFKGNLGMAKCHVGNADAKFGMAYTEWALRMEPNNTDALYLKATILHDSSHEDVENINRCIVVLHEILVINPDHKEAKNLLKTLTSEGEIGEILSTVELATTFGDLLKFQLELQTGKEVQLGDNPDSKKLN